MKDIRPDHGEEMITVWCLCHGEHGFKIYNYDDEWEIKWFRNDYRSFGVWHRLKQAYKYFMGKEVEDTPLSESQIKDLVGTLLKVLNKNGAE